MGQNDNEQLFYPYTKYENMHMQFSLNCVGEKYFSASPFWKNKNYFHTVQKEYVEPAWILVTQQLK